MGYPRVRTHDTASTAAPALRPAPHRRTHAIGRIVLIPIFVTTALALWAPADLSRHLPPQASLVLLALAQTAAYFAMLVVTSDSIITEVIGPTRTHTEIEDLLLAWALNTGLVGAGLGWGGAAKSALHEATIATTGDWVGVAWVLFVAGGLLELLMVLRSGGVWEWWLWMREKGEESSPSSVGYEALDHLCSQN